MLNWLDKDADTHCELLVKWMQEHEEDLLPMATLLRLTTLPEELMVELSRAFSSLAAYFVLTVVFLRVAPAYLGTTIPFPSDLYPAPRTLLCL